MKVELRRKSFWRGTVRNCEVVINLLAIIRDVMGDTAYCDYDMQELGVSDFEDYLAHRIANECTITIIHELTHLATGNSICDKWDEFIGSVLSR